MSDVRYLRVALTAVICSACAALVPAPPAFGGGGPEAVFLVANSRSWASLAVAHHYASLRQIPPCNVFYLDWPHSTDAIDINSFREKLLMPVLGAMQTRKVLPQIDYIVYSSDFPIGINFVSDLGDQKSIPQAAPTGSLTAMTYFASQVLNKNYGFVSMKGNFYMRQLDSYERPATSQEFRSWYGFGREGNLIEGGGQSYILSAMLGVTSNYGLSVPETIEYLRRAKEADGTKPKGTIYYCITGDSARSGTREPQFRVALESLKQLGIRAEVVRNKLPVGKKDVAGLLTGIKEFDWKASQSTLLPGALCDNFTSYGGMFTPHDQTRLTEFLRYGAAAATGTIFEPFAFAGKFPTSFAQVHYARGCNVAESVYQSVACPYQLILVGDPLCAPWAVAPTISVEGFKPGATVKGKIVLRPEGHGGTESVDRFELYVNGVFTARCATNGTLEFDTTTAPDGWAELRVVGTEAGRIETQGRLILPVRIDNLKRKFDFSCSVKGTAKWKTPITLKANAPGATRIEFTERSESIGKIEGEKGEIEIDPQTLSSGPVVLYARAQYGTDPKDAAVATPIQLTIEPTPALPGRPLKKTIKLVPGMQFKAQGEDAPLPIPATDDGKWFTNTKIRSDQTFLLESIFDVPQEDVYQFEVRHIGPLSIAVDGRTLYEVKKKQIEPMWSYVPVALAVGHHQLELRGTGAEPSGIEIRFGSSGVINLDGKQFQRFSPRPK